MRLAKLERRRVQEIMKNVTIRYTLKDDVDLDQTRARIREFVGHLDAMGAGIEYTSFQLNGTDRSFVHIGRFPSQEVVTAMQDNAWFGEFSAYLKTRCAEGPTAAFMDEVASTT